MAAPLVFRAATNQSKLPVSKAHVSAPSTGCWAQVCLRLIAADLVFAAAAQVVCACRNEARGGWPGELLRHGGSVGRGSQQVVQAAVGSVVWSWFQTQKI